MNSESLAPASEKRDIKEISELISAVEVVGVNIGAALADGKINAIDLPHAMNLLKEHQKLIDGVVGLSEVVPEAKDIDPAEAVIIVQKLYAAGLNIKKAVKGS